MTLIWIALTAIAAYWWIAVGAAAIAWWLVRLVQTVRADGYGMRPPPRSHHDWRDGVVTGR